MILLFFTSCTKEYSEYENKLLQVSIQGEVNCPGTYQVVYGSKVIDLIETSCNTTINADNSKINLDYVLKENDTITIPSMPSSNSIECVDVNSASYDDLITLPGIGDSYANRILDYRKDVGHFKSNTDLMSVKGIKEKKYEQISPFLCK